MLMGGGRLSCDRMSPSTLMHEGSRDHSCPCWCASQSVPPNRRRWFGPDARIQAFLAGPRPIPSDVSLSLFLLCFGPKMAKPSKVELLIKSDSSTVVAAHPRP